MDNKYLIISESPSAHKETVVSARSLRDALRQLLDSSDRAGAYDSTASLRGYLIHHSEVIDGENYFITIRNHELTGNACYVVTGPADFHLDGFEYMSQAIDALNQHRRWMERGKVEGWDDEVRPLKIIVTGNPVEGFTYHGPFHELPEGWLAGVEGDWWVAELKSLED